MDFRFQPQVLRVLARLRADPASGPALSDIADTLHSIETELPLVTGKGHMWMVPVHDSDWMLVCSNDEPDLVVISYLGPDLN